MYKIRKSPLSHLQISIKQHPPKFLLYSSTQQPPLIMKYSLIAIALAAEVVTVTAFPFVAEMPGVDASLLRLKPKRQQSGGSNPGGPATCPFNPNHVPAPGITAQYPYNGAQNGLPGKGVGGYQVPAPGDTAHYFVPPGPNDIVRTLLFSLISFLSKKEIRS
jgi:hypothetical protein